MASFSIDKQTLSDLNLANPFRKNSIVSIFDRTCTRQGKSRLEMLFRSPSVFSQEAGMRLEIFRHFAEIECKYPVDGNSCEDIEMYVGLSTSAYVLKLRQLFTSDQTFSRVSAGLSALLSAIIAVRDFAAKADIANSPLKERYDAIYSSFSADLMRNIAEDSACLSPGVSMVAKYNRLLLSARADAVEAFLDFCYDLDIYVSVGAVAREKGFCFPEVGGDLSETPFEAEGLYHPAVKNAVANDVRITFDGNVFFLTGANMAGKSTLMKAVGVSAFLAQIGFPCPARRLTCPVVGGICTSINVPDDISMGYSHFYAEVRRVKDIAQQVSGGGRLLVIFDELFKGTNVKDAYDATLAVISAFAEHRDCMFLVSTHIMEVAEALKKDCPAAHFHYLPTSVEAGRPVYTYRLSEGVSSDRHGMMIIRSENIIETIGSKAGGAEPSGTKKSFITDRQTLDDLHIFGRGSICEIFTRTHSRGAAAMLEEMFSHPLADAERISRRSATIAFFKDSGIDFPFKAEWFDAASLYLENTDERSRLGDIDDGAIKSRVKRSLGMDGEQQRLEMGIEAVVNIVSTLSSFLKGAVSGCEELRGKSEECSGILSRPDFAAVVSAAGSKLTQAQYSDFDDVLRFSARAMLNVLLDYIYSVDIYVSLAKTAADRGFCLAEPLPDKEEGLEIKGLFHPLLSNAVANDINVSPDNNIIFLTGANMAGKSTFMKAFSIAVFLAHLGFPVPAASMRFSVRNGLLTTINLPDNLNVGYSHFYAEVMRLKKVAESVNSNTNMVVIFDELFRGTNVKDAHEATVEVAKAFSTRKGSIFLISTHIIEAGEDLKKDCDSIAFHYLPTVMDSEIPVYTYRLESGITSDRHGMKIIRKEGILDILKI